MEDQYHQDGRCAPIMEVARHRIGIDGKGITTLVAFQGCGLRCRYCLNPECFQPESDFKQYTPKELYEELEADDVYFRATGGGVTFGGGEPCLRSKFIAEFKEICDPAWKICVESSLNVDPWHIDGLAPIVDEWLVDLKAGNPDAYKGYTGADKDLAVENLKKLPRNRVTLRIPTIPGYVDEAAAHETRLKYRVLGYEVETLEYTTDPMSKKPPREDVIYGKVVCHALTKVRKELSETYGIPLLERPCTDKGACPGTCPICEYESALLRQELGRKGVSDYSVSTELRKDIDSGSIVDATTRIRMKLRYCLINGPQPIRLSRESEYDPNCDTIDIPRSPGLVGSREEYEDFIKRKRDTLRQTGGIIHFRPTKGDDNTGD